MPISGEFSRGLFTFGATATFNNNVPQQFGHFSITGVANGTANYSFNDDGVFREWVVDLSGEGETINLLPTIGTTAISITVIPEATTIVPLTFVSLAILKRARRS